MNLIDLGNADALAAAKAKAASSSFYWAMRTLPAPQRQSMYAVYAFCREVDDIADGDSPAADKLDMLDRWRGHVERLFRPESIPAFLLEAPLRRAIELHGLRRRDFLAVIEGMVMDAERPIRAPSWTELDLYCDRAAAAVGRLSVRVFGVTDANGEALANALGRALQLTNILRDLGEDARRGRLYLPAELLAANGIVAGEDCSAVLRHPNLPAVCHALAEAAHQHFTDATIIARRCPAKAVRPAILMGAVYQALLERMRAENWLQPEQRLDIGMPLKLWLILRHGGLLS